MILKDMMDILEEKKYKLDGICQLLESRECQNCEAWQVKLESDIKNLKTYCRNIAYKIEELERGMN